MKITMRERESLSEWRRKLYGVAADIRALTARSDARERGVHYTEVQNIAAQIENIADNGGASVRSSKNDMKAMRDALEKISQRFFENGYGQHRAELNDEDRRMIESAISAPPRNCDVGTVEEQQARHSKWCHKRCIDGANEVDCIHPDIYYDLCALRWAQMPYEKGGEVR